MLYHGHFGPLQLHQKCKHRRFHRETGLALMLLLGNNFQTSVFISFLAGHKLHTFNPTQKYLAWSMGSVCMFKTSMAFWLCQYVSRRILQISRFIKKKGCWGRLLGPLLGLTSYRSIPISFPDSDEALSACVASDPGGPANYNNGSDSETCLSRESCGWLTWGQWHGTEQFA